MRDFKKIIVLLAICAAIVSCKKTITQQTVYDNVVYQVKPVQLYESASQKTKVKIDLQYISILYASLYNKSIDPSTLNDLNTLTLSIGDKQVAGQMILAKMLIDTTHVSMPSASAMRADIGKFVNDAYVKFYLRYPTPYEKYYLTNYIQQHPTAKPAVIYTGFISGNEYRYY